jgi:uncharacterized protein YhjY with autotransporter beta-barrel domain
LAVVFLAVLQPAHAQTPSRANGSALYNTNPDCSGCHGSPPDATNPTGIFNAANNPTLVADAANCGPGVNPGLPAPYNVNSCTGMNDGPTGPIQLAIGPGAANGPQNQKDVAYYIADYVAPIVHNGAVTTGFNTPITIDLTPYISGYNSAGNFTFTGGNAQSVAIVGAAPTHGAVGAPAGLSVTYTPSAAASNVNDTFSFTATSPNGNVSGTATITVHINAAPVPVASNTTVGPFVYQSTGNVINLAGVIAADNPGPPAGIATGLGSPGAPSATANGGTITAVTPPFALTYSAPIDKVTDSFTYTVSGPGGVSTAKTVTVLITTPNPPGLSPPITLPAAFNPGTPTVTTSVLTITSAFTGPVNSYGTPVEVVGPNNGTVVSGPGLGQVTYTPKPLYTGTDQFTISATNPGGTTTATVTVNVQAPTAPTRLTTPVNTNATYNNGPPAAQTTIDLSTGVFGGYVVGLQVGGVALPTTTPHGTIAQGPGAESLLYTPALGFHGVDTFQVTAYNQTGSSPAVTVNVTTNLPAVPVAHNLTVTPAIAYNTATPIDLTASITGVLNTSNPVAVTQPAHGTTTVSGKVVTYTPAATYYGGPDAFTYTASGPGGTSTPATVSLTVALPAVPTAASRPVTVIFNTPTPINLQPSVTGVVTSLALGASPSHGTASVSGFVLTYTPNAGYLGPDSLTYTATGPGGTSAPATLAITVSALPTVAPTITLNVPLNSPTTANLARFITGSGITGVEILTQPAHGSVSVNGTDITYSPVYNFFGTDSFTYRAFGAGGNATGTVTIRIQGRPNPAQDPDVSGLIDAQIAEARVFTRTQISNFDQRMESLHRAAPAESPDDAASPTARSDRTRTPLAQSLQAGASAATAPGAPTLANANSADAAIAAPLAASTSNLPVLIAAANPRQTLPPPVDPFADPPPGSLAPAASSTSALDTPNGQYRLNQRVGGAPVSSLGAVVGPTDPGSQLSRTPFPLSLSSLDLASVAGAIGAASDPATGVGTWIAGAVDFGNREQPSGLPNGLKFHTDGVSLGADRRLADNLVVGLGLGYAYDRTDVGSDGTQSRASGTVVAAYASYQPTPKTYVDAVVGFGTLDFDTARFVAPVDEVATGHRTGEQAFASITAGYDIRANELHVSPYARLDFATDRLHQYTESGAGLNALTYSAQNVPTTDLALGVRLDAQHDTSFGSVVPHARLEYQHDFEGQSEASVSYADLFNGPSYGVPTNTIDRNALIGGIGVDFYLRRGLMFGIDYQALRSTGNESSQMIRFRLSQELDADLLPTTNLNLLPPGAFTSPVGLRADASYTYDDNVTRNDGDDKLSDQSYALNVSRPFLIPIVETAQAIVTPFVGGEKFDEYGGLNHVLYGVNGEVQYRSGSEFASPIYAIFINTDGENYSSYERTGYRYTVGLSVTKPLTDRISLFGALAYDNRHGRSEVFDDQDGSARLNLDYALNAHGTFYMSGEYRRGDVVSTGQSDLGSLDIASAYVKDDVFSTDVTRFSYRFRANTYLLGVGYNYALGATDSLDFSWRWAQSTPLHQPGFAGADFIRYFDNQFTVVYLVRF